ncbi:hypothetical protein NQZ79_g4864 [Umbelopsis isabellina]|nr:hypothetical protein NQZ79_g4864 [Umbelopsis isabellina]
MMSDYGYLEDVSRRADTLSRLNMKNDPQKLISKNATAKQKELLKQTKRLGINLSMLPAGMKRRKLNCTNYIPKQQTIFWTVECIFASCNNERVLQHKIPSSKSLRDIFDEILFQETSLASNALTRYKLRDYIDAGTDSFIIGLKKEFVPAAEQHNYIDLTPHMDAPLVDTLKGESLCEFPTLYIWLHSADSAVVLEEKNEKATFRSITGIVNQQSKEQPKPEEEAEAIEEMEEVIEEPTVSSSAESESSESSSEESSDSEDDEDDDKNDDNDDQIEDTGHNSHADGSNHAAGEPTSSQLADTDTDTVIPQP